MTFIEHLAELRSVLLKIVVAVSVCSAIAFLYGEKLLKMVTQVSDPQFVSNRWFCQLAVLLNLPGICINKTPLSLINIELAGQFTLHIKLATYAGVILSIPYIFLSITRFILPALKRKERQLMAVFFAISIILLIIGVLFGYYIIAPIAVHFLANYSLSGIIVNQITVQSFMSSVCQTVLAMGVGFELPLAVFFLTKWHIVDVGFLKRNRPVVFVVILTLAAIITPPDVFSMVIVAMPLWLLYELSIYATNWAKTDE